MVAEKNEKETEEKPPVEKEKAPTAKEKKAAKQKAMDERAAARRKAREGGEIGPPKTKEARKKRTDKKIAALQESLETDQREVQETLGELVYLPEMVDSLDLQNPESVVEFPKNLAKRTEALSARIDIIDDSYNKIRLQVEKSEATIESLGGKRTVLKALIVDDQEKIFTLENKLAVVPESQYRPNLPAIARGVAHYVFGLDDEIILRSEISKSQVKITQRQSRLVELNTQLLQVSVLSTWYKDTLDGLEKVGERYRLCRQELGELRREVDVKIKKHWNDVTNAQIQDEFTNKLQKINQLTPNLQGLLGQQLQLGQDYRTKFEALQETTVRQLTELNDKKEE